ncbi:uncharacterized protein N7483_009148 [Penicillium malachiteum]|uniref:uncharacterized protein n=1 Tax=Penicillium malachiteum TaxID=1324776 RepID=UPI002549B191|nr:uncharacterized protein N7483_009148 [Penicillium malachiteum]KAJ5721214.1 hypothetical protein N7483_009148 [Penicillium malachiteum]
MVSPTQFPLTLNLAFELRLASLLVKMNSEIDQLPLWSGIDVEAELRFLVLLIFSILANADALHSKLKKIKKVKKKFRINLKAGNILIAMSIGEILHYYDEVEDYHVVIDNSLKRASSTLQQIKEMEDLKDLTQRFEGWRFMD